MRRGEEPKIPNLKLFFTPSPPSTYSNPSDKKIAKFRLECAGSSLYRGAPFFTPRGRKRKYQYRNTKHETSTNSQMPIEKRCDNCTFSTFATGPGRPILICRQKKGAEGRWKTRPLMQKCPNFHPSRAANPDNSAPRLIPLTRGQFAIVDAKDYPALTKYKWFAEGANGKYYAVRKKNGKSIKMHRQIKKAPPHLVVDHIDHNGLNNTNANLRLATFTQNCQNQQRASHKTSKYKGVHWHKKQKKWAAQITANKKPHHLGYFKEETQAAKAYDRAAKKYHRQFASLNFPNNAASKDGAT